MGPTSYNPKKGIAEQESGFTNCFKTGRDKDLLFGGNQNPGPGEYKGASTELNSLGGKVWSHVGAFGKTERRFKDEKEKAPGPGAYNVVKKKKKAPVTHYMFKSRKQRDTFDAKSMDIDYENL